MNTWLRHYAQQNKVYAVEDVYYLASVKHNISMMQVTNEAHLQYLLSKRCNCCGDKVQNCFRYATPEEIELWNSPE